MDKCVKITFYRNNKIRFYLLTGATFQDLLWSIKTTLRVVFTFKDKQLWQK